MAKKDRTAHARGIRFAERQDDRRFVRIHPWVPESKADEVLAFCKKLREEAMASEKDG